MDGENIGVAVVGGGISGLAAAIRVASSGARVTLFERAEAAGGRAKSFERAGYTLNLGPHALYADAERELNALGVEADGAVPQANGYAIAGGKAHTLPAGARTLFTSSLFRGFARAKAVRLFALLSTTDPASVRGISLGQWLDRVAGQGTPRQAIEAYFRLACYANAPEHLDAGAALRQFNAGRGGVKYLHSGWASMVAAMRSRAESLGVVIRTGERVEAVRPVANGVSLTLHGGPSLQASAVVLAVPPSIALELLGDAAPRETRARLRNVVPVRAAVFDVGLSRLPDPKGSFALGIDQPLYLQAHSLYAKLAPDGGVLVSTAMYLPVENPPSAGEARATLEGMLDIAQPGWREAKTMESFMPDLVVQHGIPVAGVGRPSVQSGLPGISFAGDWVGGDRLLAEACFASAREAAEYSLHFVANEAAPALVAAL